MRIAFDRPEVRNAFRPHTVDELYRVLDHARMSPDVGCVLLTGNGPSPKDGGWAFCSGGDQRIRGRDGYQYAEGDTADTIDPARAGRLHILEVQRLIRMMPKVVIAVVPGWAAGGGHCLHVVCDLTLASARARPVQADRRRRRQLRRRLRLGLPRPAGRPEVRPRRSSSSAREHSADDAHRMGMVNEVVAARRPRADRDRVGRDDLGKSPTAQRMLKFAFNAVDDGLVGQQVFAGEATRLAYMTDEAVEGRDAFLEKREPDWSRLPVRLLRCAGRSLPAVAGPGAAAGAARGPRRHRAGGRCPPTRPRRGCWPRCGPDEPLERRRGRAGRADLGLDRRAEGRPAHRGQPAGLGAAPRSSGSAGRATGCSRCR